MKKLNLRPLMIAGLCGLVMACSSKEELPQTGGTLSLTTSVNPFDGETATKTNIAGTVFADGDRMKLKIICPYSERTEYGETTHGDTMDAFWLMKWAGSNWTPITSADKVDVGGSYRYTYARNLMGHYEAQQTPYVYTASTWSENVRFMSGGNYISQYSYVFHADQSEEQNYFRSDLLWAQTYMQTGAYNVHLSFNHVMACLKISISGVSLSANTVVTLEGMPDIDQYEVVVGDYYASRSKINARFGYKEKSQCNKEDNGKVLGVSVIRDDLGKAVIYKMDGQDIGNDAVYTAYYNSGYFYLIVPPCTLTNRAKFWIRDGEKRYNYELQTLTFEEGKLYPVNITLSE